MRRKASFTSFAAALLAVLALVRRRSRPRRSCRCAGKEYSTKGYQGGVSVNLVTNATNAKSRPPGPARKSCSACPPQGGMYLQCPSAPKSSTWIPIASIPVPVVHAQALARPLRLLDG